MKKLLFWGITTLLLASAAHIATAVVMPRMERERTLQNLTSTLNANQLTLLDQAKRGTFDLKGISPDLAVALCPFDITSQPVSITAPLPGFYWSVSIFNLEGRNLYTINDKQVGTNQFSALIVKNSEQTDVSEDAPQRRGEGIIIRSNTDQGIVLLRIFIPDRASMQRVENVLGLTRCQTVSNGISSS